MKRFLGYGLLGLLAFLLFLLLRAPAGLVVGLFDERLPGLNVQAVDGTVLNGSAWGVSWRDTSIGKLNWNWRPFVLLSGWLEFRLDTDDPDAKLMGNVAMGWDRQLRFRDFSGRLPLAKLSELAGQPTPPLRGMVEFDLRELKLNAAGLPQSAAGVVHLLNLHIMLGQPLNLGDFVVQLSPATPEGLQGVVKDNNAPLDLAGILNVSPDRRYRFSGSAAVRDAGNQALRQMLNLLGPPGGDGRWKLDFSGTLAR
ncbi:MAG TPA: type II secretion system protein N [Candidatus Competibacter phosphatis]|nr:type II secretion system protein N [Candidatus Competibacter phosphatis]HMR02247.1 type II secretion system protein N [Candidatus Competibacter phosphatis]